MVVISWTIFKPIWNNFIPNYLKRQKDNEGWNCLHASASCGYVEIARYLVDQGINIAEVTCDGELASDVCEDRANFKLTYI